LQISDGLGARSSGGRRVAPAGYTVRKERSVPSPMAFIALVPVTHYTPKASDIALTTTHKASCPNPVHKVKSLGNE